MAALADRHCTKASQGAFLPLFARIAGSAGLLLLGGDLTDYGLPEDARVMAKELTVLRIPVAAVLGNHDVESGKAEEVTKILVEAGLHVLDGDACELLGIGIAGVKGFGGGFGKRALGPSAIKAPMAMPAAGQKTATPPGLARKARPNRAAMK